MKYRNLALSAALAAAAVLPCPVHAQTYTDTAANSAYAKGYDKLGGAVPGFGAFTAALGGTSAGTFIASASEAEAGNGKPGAIDTAGRSFGTYAQTGTDSSVTVSRAFHVPGRPSGLRPGDTFALDFVTGYNDGLNGTGRAGVALVTANGIAGDFHYQSGNQYVFEGKTITGQPYVTGPLHLLYTLTSPKTYTLKVTGALTFSGTGRLTGPVTGFQVQQKNAAVADPSHNAYFNNLNVKCKPK